MGTIFASTCATLSMGFHEINLYTIFKNKFTLLVYHSTTQLFWTKLEKIFRWLFRIFKVKFNKAKRIARCFKQYQPCCIIYYRNKWYLGPTPWCHDKVFMDIYSKATDP